MVAINRKKKGANLPCIGIWNQTANNDMPPACTLLGLWNDPTGSHVSFCCAIYRDEDGSGVDPYEEDWSYITWHSRQGNEEGVWDEEMDEAPDYWAECRFLIPAWGDK